MATIDTATPAVGATDSRLPHPPWRRRLSVVLGVTLVAVATWALARLAIGAPLTVTVEGTTEQTVGAASVAAAALLAGLAGWTTLSLLSRLTTRALTIWTLVAGAATAVSLAGPLGATASLGTTLTLAGLHLLVGGGVIAGLRRTES